MEIKEQFQKKKNLTSKKTLRSTLEKNSFLIMEQFTRANGKKIRGMVMVCRYGPMVQNMKGDGEITRLMAEGSSGTQMETFLTAIGKKIRLMAKAYTFMSTELSMMVNGLMISSMGRA